MKKEALRIFYNKYRLMIYPLVLVISCLTLIMLVIVPQVNNFLSTQKKMAEINLKSQVLGDKARDLEDLNEVSLKKKLQTALLALPQEAELTQIVATLQAVVASSGFSLVSLNIIPVSIDPRQTGGSQGVNVVDVKIDVVGPKKDVDDFLEALENAPRVMRIGSIDTNFQRGEDLGGSQLKMDVYFTAAPKSLGAADAPLPKLTENDETLLATLEKITVGKSATVPITGPLLPTGKQDPFE